MMERPKRNDSQDLAELVASARAGDTNALDRLCRRCYAEINEFFRTRIPEEADDLTQNLFAGLPRKLEGYEESGRFMPWLRGVAYNMFLTAIRTGGRRREATLVTGLAHPDPETATLFRTAKGELRALVGKLSESLRAAWDLHAQGYSNAEIGAALGISETAVGARVSRARKQLFDWLVTPPAADEDPM